MYVKSVDHPHFKDSISDFFYWIMEAGNVESKLSTGFEESYIK